MREDYQIKGPTQKIELDLEVPVQEALLAMEKHTKIPRSTLANVALKRFISQHKDYLPPNFKPTQVSK